jgi:hypothetical protein
MFNTSQLTKMTSAHTQWWDKPVSATAFDADRQLHERIWQLKLATDQRIHMTAFWLSLMYDVFICLRRLGCIPSAENSFRGAVDRKGKGVHGVRLYSAELSIVRKLFWDFSVRLLPSRCTSRFTHKFGWGIFEEWSLAQRWRLVTCDLKSMQFRLIQTVTQAYYYANERSNI